MKERPILFSAPMVRAILDGRKTQTRRSVKHVITGPNPPNNYYDWHDRKTGKWLGAHGGNLEFNITNASLLCPYGKPGDRLWVMETFSYHEIPEGEPFYYPADRLRECVDHDYGFHYWADGQPEFGNWSKPKPSIHMPRSASRILLEITGVRVERLQDISEQDAVFEGLKALTKDDGKTIKYGIPDNDGYPGNDDIGWHWCDWHVSPILAYKRLWESINGNGSWDLNPWVWVIEFDEIKKSNECNAFWR